MDKERVEELFKLKLCRTLNNMEKEHSASCQSAPTDNHIVAVPAG